MDQRMFTHLVRVVVEDLGAIVAEAELCGRDCGHRISVVDHPPMRIGPLRLCHGVPRETSRHAEGHESYPQVRATDGDL